MSGRNLQSLAVIVLLMSAGCDRRSTHETHGADTLATIVGDMFNPFVHGNPFYGSVVYLIPNTQSSRDWWHLLSIRPNYWMRSPKDLGLQYVDRTTSEDGGHFAFSNVQPGDYFLHANVFWVTFAVGAESTEIGGRAWIGRTTVAASETVHVHLTSPEYVFKGDVVGTEVPSRSGPMAQIADSLPVLGEYVYVEQLPEAVTKVTPVYPAAARSAGVDGTVLVQALVGKDGLVKDTRVVRSIPLLDQAAEAAVRRWVFKPALSNNKPVAVWVTVPVRFRL